MHSLTGSIVSARPLVVALDGPSDSGKTTLASCLLTTLDRPVVILPCYADLAGPSTLPPAVASTAEAQLDGLEFYLDLDRQRAQSLGNLPPGAVVIADRSWLGLLAHVYAVQATGGPAAYEAARARVEDMAGDLLQPDIALFLLLSAEQRKERIDDGDGDRWFTSDILNESINGFFENQAPVLAAGTVRTVDAGLDASAVCATAREAILERGQGAA